MSGLKIFVSHSHDDKELARKLVDLLYYAISLRPDEITCTSVEGLGLLSGGIVDDDVRRQIGDAEFLICLLTRNAIESQWVWLELGARWYVNKSLIPLYTSDVTPEELGPLLRFNAVNCSDELDVHKVIEDAGSALKKMVNRPDFYLEKLKAFVAAARQPITQPQTSSSNTVIATPAGVSFTTEQLSPDHFAVMLALLSEEHVRSDYWVAISNLNSWLEKNKQPKLQHWKIKDVVDDLKELNFLDEENGLVKLNRIGRENAEHIKLYKIDIPRNGTS